MTGMFNNSIFKAKLEYTGSRPGRAKEFCEERIFLHLWREYNGLGCIGTFPNMAMAEIASLAGLEELMDRDAYVATSVVQWLGAGIGAEFLDRANKLAESVGKESAYTHVWQREMLTSMRGVDGGFRGIEHILNSRLIPFDFPELEGLDQVSERDLGVALGTIRWLANSRGQEFIDEAERRIAVQKSRNSALFHVYWNAYLETKIGKKDIMSSIES